MRRPRVKEFLRIYHVAGEPHLYIGIGPEKFRIMDPSEEMVSFVLDLDGTRTREELRERYPESEDWLAVLSPRASSTTPPSPRRSTRTTCGASAARSTTCGCTTGTAGTATRACAGCARPGS